MHISLLRKYELRTKREGLTLPPALKWKNAYDRLTEVVSTLVSSLAWHNTKRDLHLTSVCICQIVSFCLCSSFTPFLILSLLLAFPLPLKMRSIVCFLTADVTSLACIFLRGMFRYFSHCGRCLFCIFFGMGFFLICYLMPAV